MGADMLIGETILLAALAILSAIAVLDRVTGTTRSFAYARYLWIFALAFCVTVFWSVPAAVWVLALLSFAALREYFTLVDLRLQDRWGVLGAYLAIPFMTFFIQADWYGMFIISIPVYAFLGIPLLVALGGRESDGTVFSIGAINLGLFLMVYCLGHISYLMLQSVWRAVFLVGSVAASDLFARKVVMRDSSPWLRGVVRTAGGWPLTLGLALLLSDWAGFPLVHALALGTLVPILVCIANVTLQSVEADLRIDTGDARSGRGQILNSIKAYLYAGPIVFHYCRYYLT